MTDSLSPPHTTDICLLLRVHGEELWLNSRLMPVLLQLEARDGLPDEELGAALAYLEVLWIEARGRAAETDAAYATAPPTNGDGRALRDKAHRYHAALRRLRASLGSRIARELAATSDEAPEHEHASF